LDFLNAQAENLMPPLIASAEVHPLIPHCVSCRVRVAESLQKGTHSKAIFIHFAVFT
jgi:hypothetical protein